MTSESPVNRRSFIGGAAAVAAAAGLMSASALRTQDPPAPDPSGTGGSGAGPTAGAWPTSTDLPATSTFFATAFIEYYGTHSTDSDGDLWPNCWADDGAVYAANGDGKGFDLDAESTDAVVNRIEGTPEKGLTGTRLAAGADLGPIWGDPDAYNRKPTGMACVDGVLYLALQDLKFGDDAFNAAPTASISRSDDHGRTWHATATPMFPDSRFTTVFFLDFGKDYALAPAALGASDGSYVYAYGLDWNWRDSYGDVVQDPTRLYLARAPRDGVQDRSRWEFFTGQTDGRPAWSADIRSKRPVLTDRRRQYQTLRESVEGPNNLSVISQGGVVYNAPLRRYLYTSWTEYTFEFYESPTPWGPWKLFLIHDAGCYPWMGTQGGDAGLGPKNGGYGTTIPAKFISDDGLTMWVQSNYFVHNLVGQNNYQFDLRRLTVSPARPGGKAEVAPSTENLARATGVVPLEKSAHYGNWQYYSDGDRTKSEDSWDGANKEWDWWGYAWPRTYRIGRVVYTSGAAFPDGGWFSPFDGGLRVQVRRNFEWVDVQALSISPAYPYDKTAVPYRTYTLTFEPLDCDGVRIIGAPGGASYFTSIAELEVYSG